MKLTEKSASVFEYLKNNGGKVSVDELADALGRTTRSINANVTDLQKKGLIFRDKVEGEGEDAKAITYVCITDDAEEILAAPDEE